MENATRDMLANVPERLAVIAGQLGELTLAYERLARRRPDVQGERAVDAPDPELTALEPAPDDALTRTDRIAYLDTARGVLYRLLFVVDFTLAHERIDRALLTDARTTLVDGIDAVDACLLLDGAGQPAGTGDA